MKNCPFCPLIKLTKWYLKTNDNIVVCEDLNPKRWKVRLLVVGSGEGWHRPKNQYSEEEINKLINLGIKVANSLIKKKLFHKISYIDKDHLSIVNHYHIQICLE